MPRSSQNDAAIFNQIDVPPREAAASAAIRLNSQELFQQKREVEIEHGDRIYRLRITQLNKLILTA
jgi:hemin uptake protein HemP